MHLNISINHNFDFLYNILCIKLNINLKKIPKSKYFIIKNNADELFGIYRVIPQDNKEYTINDSWIESSVKTKELEEKILNEISSFFEKEPQPFFELV